MALGAPQEGFDHEVLVDQSPDVAHADALRMLVAHDPEMDGEPRQDRGEQLLMVHASPPRVWGQLCGAAGAARSGEREVGPTEDVEADSPEKTLQSGRCR